jgi:hypothetical protein
MLAPSLAMSIIGPRKMHASPILGAKCKSGGIARNTCNRGWESQKAGNQRGGANREGAISEGRLYVLYSFVYIQMDSLPTV